MRLSTATLFAVPLALVALTTTPVFGDDHDKKTDITLSQPVQVPGGVVLQPGTYMFILEDSASSRHIVEIKSEDGKQLYAMMFTTRANRVKRTGDTVLTYYEMPAGQPVALRQWFWPGDYDGQEFLYPHDQAVTMNPTSKEKVSEVPNEDYQKLQERGFSSKYPVSTNSNVSGQPSNPNLNSNGQSSTFPNQNSNRVPDQGPQPGNPVTPSR